MNKVVSQLAGQFTEPPLAEPLQTAGNTLRGLLDSDGLVSAKFASPPQTVHSRKSRTFRFR